ncbi:MAG TPA: redoxin domain-containing protein [Planctomycetota bacterium]|nr:redoxin domain-containing protein [Planctomycetota bacterium]
MTDHRPRFLMAAALLAASLASGCAAVAEGKAAPPVRGSGWLPSAGPADDAVAGKWGLIVFFRAGSQSCAEGMPAVLALKRDFGAKGLVVVGVTPSDAEATTEFAKDNGIDFPVLTDAQHVVDSYDIPEVNELHTYLVNPPGIVIVQGDLEKARELLGKYMAPPAASTAPEKKP